LGTTQTKKKLEQRGNKEGGKSDSDLLRDGAPYKKVNKKVAPQNTKRCQGWNLKKGGKSGGEDVEAWGGGLMEIDIERKQH